VRPNITKIRQKCHRIFSIPETIPQYAPRDSQRGQIHPIEVKPPAEDDNSVASFHFCQPSDKKHLFIPPALQLDIEFNNIR